MNANDQFFARDAKVDAAAVAPLPSFAQDLRRGLARRTSACRCARSRSRDTPASFGAEKNPPLAVYDTSGPYTDPAAQHRHPLGPAAAARALDRRARRHGELDGPDVARTAARASPIPTLAELRFDLHAHAAPREGRRERDADALRAPRHRHAGDGVHRDPREPAARGDAARSCPRALRRQHPGQSFGASDPAVDHARIRARRSRARPRDHPDQHQPSGNRADDHRPQLPGEDQRQHRQLGGVVVDRRGSREDDVGDPLGRATR